MSREGTGRRRDAVAPGRVNLIGDHTDYNQGLALPMAIDLGVRAEWRSADRASDELEIRTDIDSSSARVPLDLLPEDVAAFRPAWARYAAGVAVVLRDQRGRAPGGGRLELSSTVPAGSGLSSSAAVCVATALALGAPRDDPLELARACQRAEALAGSDVGLMDQLCSLEGREGHALLLDFRQPSWEAVALPGGLGVLVVDSGERRDLRTSPYAQRRAECEEAARRIGPLGSAGRPDLEGLGGALRRRARHVVTECERVREVVEALAHGALGTVGRLLDESHASLAGDLECSTPRIDALARDLRRLPGVAGVRLTGGGFGGSVVAVGDGEALGRLVPSVLGCRSWVVRAAEGARVL